MNVVTELRVIAQSEWEDYPLKVREVCAEAAEQLSYHRALVAAMATHEKQLRDELIRQLERREKPGQVILRPLTVEDWIE